MSATTVRTLTEDDWPTYREIRLEALADSPEAFVASEDSEKQLQEERWRSRMGRARRLLAENNEGRAAGVVSLRIDQIEGADRPYGELFGLWVRPDARGTGVSVALLEAALEQARKDDLGAVVYWVGTDNAPGVSFASGHGFRPTDSRRPMKRQTNYDSESTEEAAFIYPLAADPNEVPSSVLGH